MNNLLEVKSLSFRYRKKMELILNNIDLSIEKGCITAIIGMSGIGKTTLIKILNGTIHYSTHKGLSGDILLYGESYKTLKKTDINKKIGTVFQDPDTQIIFSNVEDELAFGMENYCVPREEMHRGLDEVLHLLGIEDLRYRNPNELSGGEKQLVVLGAILCLNVDIIILDECMTQVDRKGKERLLAVLKRLSKNGKTIIMVEHDYGNLKIADYVFELSQGKLLRKHLNILDETRI